MKSKRIIFPSVGRAEIEEFDLEDPATDEVQIKTAANGICMFEVSVFRGTEPLSCFPGGRAGHEGIGQVVKAGRDVKHLREGDWVPSHSWATYENLPAADRRAFSRPPLKPEFWLTEPASCVVRATHSYAIVPGDRVLLLGAGYMGLLNVQMLASCPVGELVVADVKASNLTVARQLGATETILINRDGEVRLQELEAQPFDLVIEAAGVPSALSTATRLTRRGGRLAIFAWHHQPGAVDLGSWHMKGLKVLNCAPSISTDYSFDSFERSQRLFERGVLDMSPLITHRHHFEDAQAALDLASERPEGYIKGVLTF